MSYEILGFTCLFHFMLRHFVHLASNYLNHFLGSPAVVYRTEGNNHEKWFNRVRT